MKDLVQHIEAILFAADAPVSVKEMQKCLADFSGEKIKEEAIESAIEELAKAFETPSRAFGIEKISGGYQFLSKEKYHETISKFLNQKTRRRLSRAALETLSIVAYKQPVSRAEMERIRGVGVDYSIQKLLEKELIEIAGRAESPGRPLLYKTSDTFYEYFGIHSTTDLPKLKELEVNLENSIGENSDGEEAQDFENSDRVPNDEIDVPETSSSKDASSESKEVRESQEPPGSEATDETVEGMDQIEEVLNSENKSAPSKDS